MKTINDKNELQIFSYHGNNVRTLQNNNASLWILKDLCEVLNIEKYRDVAARLDEDERVSVLVDTLGGVQKMIAVTEAGLYSVILLSRKPEAKRFKKWITHEVLPSIWRHGAYFTASTAEKLLNDPDAMIKLFTTIKEERSEKECLQAKVESDKSKVIFADAVSVSQGAISVADLAKILKGNGIEIGQKRLFQRLREEGFLIKREGSDRNSPTQRAMQLGLFRIKETAITRSDGRITISKTAKVTGRGQCYFIDYFLNKREFSYAD